MITKSGTSVNSMLPCFPRQILTFLEAVKTPVEPIRAEYLNRGSLQYEFGSELLQTPIQLLRITNAEAQVRFISTVSSELKS